MSWWQLGSSRARMDELELLLSASLDFVRMDLYIDT